VVSRLGKDKLDIENEGPITKTTLVLCEGKRDASFISHLAKQRNIEGIQIGFPTPQNSDSYGEGGFKSYLVTVRAISGFKNLKRIIILRDCDEDPGASFKSVIDQISEANNQIADAKYDIPSEPEKETEGILKVVVRMIPNKQEKGNLDSLLLGSIDFEKHPNSFCFQQYFACCKTDALSIGRAAKIKLTTILAASCIKNPAVSLAFVWSQQENPIPLDSPNFDELASFLRKYSEDPVPKPTGPV